MHLTGSQQPLQVMSSQFLRKKGRKKLANKFRSLTCQSSELRDFLCYDPGRGIGQNLFICLQNIPSLPSVVNTNFTLHLLSSFIPHPNLQTGSQVEWGKKEAGEPADFVLMSPMHDTRFWYHDLIGQITDCRQSSNEYWMNIFLTPWKIPLCARMLSKLIHSSIKNIIIWQV